VAFALTIGAMADKKTLAPDQMITERVIGRRSALGYVAAAAGAALVAGTLEGCRHTGCSDSDSTDRATYGVHCGTTSGCSDSDTGTLADASGHGVHCSTGCTDSDTSDRAGAGRHCI